MGGKRDYIRVAQEDVRPGVPHVRTLDDPSVLENARDHVYRARWQLFLPTLAIAMLYGAAWIYLNNEGRSDSALARLSVIIMAVGVPVLAVHAFLRYQTIRLQLLPTFVRYHPGWPKDVPVDLPYELVEKVRVRRGVIGLLTGSGTLVLHLTTGEKVAIADLSNAGMARREVENVLASSPS